MSPDSARSNETIRHLLHRSTCRSFHDKKIPSAILATVLEAAQRAASGGNLQPFSIIKIEHQKTKDRLMTICGSQPFIATAPVDLMFCIDFRRLKRWAALSDAPFTAHKAFRHFWISFQDTIIAAQSVCVAADAVGLGSVYVGSVLECFREVRDILRLPDQVFPVVLLCLGYPKHRPEPRPKLPLQVLVHDETYNDLPDDALLRAFDQKYHGTSRMAEVNEKRLERLERACKAAHGPEVAEQCLARVKSDGRINAAQSYFGLHYCADEMPIGNDDFLYLMEHFGFEWFKRWQPLKG